MSVQLQALADEVFDAAAALELVVPPELRPIVSLRSEIQVAMVQAFTPQFPSPLLGEGQDGGYSILSVQSDGEWRAVEDLIRAEGAERGTDAMTAELIALHRWRATHTPHRFYVAYHGNRAVAHVGLFQHRTTAYLHALFTHPEYRQRGAGSLLTLAMGSAAQSMGCERVVLQCPRDSGLPAYFKRLGFRSVGGRQIWTKPY